MNFAAYIEATSGLIGLSVEAASMPGVVDFLELAAGMAAVLDGVDLDDAELELAPIFSLPDTGAADD